MTSRIEFDTSQMPLIVLTLEGALRDKDYERLFDEYEKIARTRQPFILITDVRKLTKVASARERQTMAERLKKTELEYGGVRRGGIVVIESALVRGALTAFRWLTGRDEHEQLAGSMNEALVKAAQIAQKSALTLPLTKLKVAGK